MAVSPKIPMQDARKGVFDDFRWRLADPVPLSEIHRALIIKLRHHGDFLLTSPVFSTLARCAPHAEIDALVYRETAPMLANHPAIAAIHTIDRDWKRQGTARQAAAEWHLLRLLRARHYDLLMHLTEHRRGLVFAHILRPRYAVTLERKGLLWRRYFTHFYGSRAQSARHTIEANLDGLRRIGIYPEPIDKKVVLIPGAAAEARIDAVLARHRLRRGEFVHVHPGSRWLFKCWPPECMGALLNRIVASGRAIAITGSPDSDEEVLVAATLAACTPKTRSCTTNLAGTLTLPEVAALTARARAFVGVDSAPMHIAAAMGTPTLALFGPSDERMWGPW